MPLRHPTRHPTHSLTRSLLRGILTQRTRTLASSKGDPVRNLLAQLRALNSLLAFLTQLDQSQRAPSIMDPPEPLIWWPTSYPDQC
jgi:hypothetical protein